MRLHDLTISASESLDSHPGGFIVVRVLPRLGRICLFVFQSLWFAVIIPAHPRGIVTVECATPSVHCYPEHARKCHDSNPSSSGSRDRQHCAVCFFAARTAPPPVVEHAPPPLGFLTFVFISPSFEPAKIGQIPTSDTRAPPSV